LSGLQLKLFLSALHWWQAEQGISVVLLMVIVYHLRLVFDILLVK
jgi:hypothetical protein